MLCSTTFITLGDVKNVLPQKEAPQEEQVAAVPTISLRDKERQKIMDTLLIAKTKKEAADMLGLSKTTLWRKIREYGIE